MLLCCCAFLLHESWWKWKTKVWRLIPNRQKSFLGYALFFVFQQAKADTCKYYFVLCSNSLGCFKNVAHAKGNIKMILKFPLNVFSRTLRIKVILTQSNVLYIVFPNLLSFSTYCREAPLCRTAVCKPNYRFSPDLQTFSNYHPDWVWWHLWDPLTVCFTINKTLKFRSQ